MLKVAIYGKGDDYIESGSSICRYGEARDTDRM
jgi:hypothetical protein